MQPRAPAAGERLVRGLLEQRVREAECRGAVRVLFDDAGGDRLVEGVERVGAFEVRGLGERGEREIASEHRGGPHQAARGLAELVERARDQAEALGREREVAGPDALGIRERAALLQQADRFAQIERDALGARRQLGDEVHRR